MSHRNEQCYTMSQDWINWLDSRRFLGSPEQLNILAKLMAQNKMSKESPNGPMSAELNAFNAAVMSLEKEGLLPFLSVYCGLRECPIKTMAHYFEVDRATIYNRAHQSANYVMRLTQQLIQSHMSVEF